MNRINLVNNLDTLENMREIDISKLNEDKIYSVRLDFLDIEPQILTETSLKKLKKIVNRKEYRGAKIYIKEGDYFD